MTARPPLAPGRDRPLLGVGAMLCVVAIYAVNFVVTRYSVLNGLAPLDLVALRYGVAGVVLLPYFWRLGLADLGGLGWWRGVTLACLAGSPYMTVFYYGLSLAPASHGGVLNPGIVPSVVFLGLVFLGRQRFSVARALSLLSIVLGLVLVTRSSFQMQGPVLLGDTLLLVTGISWGLFTLLARVWNLRPLQGAAIVSVISLLFLPPYLAFSYNGFESVSFAHVLSQAMLQGVVNAIVSVYLVTYAVQKLGAQMTALFSPMVPVLTTLLAIPVLGEIPTSLQSAGIVVVVFGMLSAVLFD